MNLYQRKYIPAINPWEPNFFGHFFDSNNVTFFVYTDADNLSLLPQNCDMPMVIHTDIGDDILPLPSNWTFLEDDGHPYLMVQPNVVIDLLLGKQLSYIPKTLQAKFLACVRSPIYYVDHQFYFEDYCISHKGACGYRCTKADKVIWDFSGRGYLYTDIVRWDNHIFFGTAGNGGYFYVLHIDSGELVAGIKTGGTASFAQMGHLCYVASRGTKQNTSKLLCIDLHDGRIVQEFELKGTVTEDSRLQITGLYLHIVTFEYKGNHLRNAIWNTVKVETEK